MIRFTVNTSGVENDITGQIAPIIRAFTRAIEAESKRLMVLPKSGRTYKKRGGRVHTASAQGEAPAIDYGGLFRSYRANFPAPNVGELAINAEYAEYLEYGTRRMKKRPFVRPGIEGAAREFVRQGIFQSFRARF